MGGMGACRSNKSASTIGPNYLLVLSSWSVSEEMTMCKDQLKM